MGRGRCPRALAALALVLALASTLTPVSLAGSCTVEIHRTTPGSDVKILNIAEVELLSSVSPLVRVPALTRNLSSAWNASYTAARCFDSNGATFCATSNFDARALLVVTYNCSKTLVAVRISNRLDCASCVGRINAFSLSHTDEFGARQTVRFPQLGASLASYIVPILPQVCGPPPPPDPCAGKTCPAPSECQANVTCAAGACVASNKPDLTTACAGGVGTCLAGVCHLPSIGGAATAFCASSLRTNFTVECWGFGIYGEKNVTAGLGSVIALAGGSEHICALRTNGSVACWGGAWYDINPPAGTDGGVTAIAVGYEHTLALRSTGTVVCWGDNRFKQCDMPANLTDVVSVGAGSYHSCAAHKNGSLTCWGSDSSQYVIDVPADIQGQAAALIAGASDSTCVTLAPSPNGSPVACWGSGIDNFPLPAEMANGSIVSGLAGCYIEFCAIHSAGRIVSCWGANDKLVGDAIPADARAGGGVALAFDRGFRTACVALTDNSIVCWGEDSYDLIAGVPSKFYHYFS